MSVRTFVVRVSTAPARVVVEDVRSRRRAVADDLEDVGVEIAALLADERSTNGDAPEPGRDA
jgi:hypothetical protein